MPRRPSSDQPYSTTLSGNCPTLLYLPHAITVPVWSRTSIGGAPDGRVAGRERRYTGSIRNARAGFVTVITWIDSSETPNSRMSEMKRCDRSVYGVTSRPSGSPTEYQPASCDSRIYDSKPASRSCRSVDSVALSFAGPMPSSSIQHPDRATSSSRPKSLS